MSDFRSFVISLTPFPRFGTEFPILNTNSTLTANIRRRRGSKVAINMPIYVDENTPRPFIDPTVPRDRNDWPEDASAFDVSLHLH